jgi:hypothetical protein
VNWVNSKVKKHLFVVISAAIASIFFYAIARYFTNLVDFYSSDFFKLWLGGKLLIQGLDPYDSHTWLSAHDLYKVAWKPNPTYLYPLPLAILFLPFSQLPLDRAYTLWFFISIWAVVISILLLLRLANNPRMIHLALPLIAGAFLFRPTIVTLRNGQLGAVLLLVLALVVYFWQKECWFTGGVVLGLLILKPQLGIPLLLLVGVWLLLLRRWRAILGTGITGIVLLITGLSVDPGWVSGFAAAGTQRFIETFGYSPTIFGLVGAYCEQNSNCALLYGGAASILLSSLVIWLLVSNRNFSPTIAIAVLTPVALLVTPYTWAYDQILLVIPISLVVILLFTSNAPFLFSASLFLLLDLGALILLAVAVQMGNDIWSAAIPFACLMLVFLAAFRADLRLRQSHNINIHPSSQ